MKHLFFILFFSAGLCFAETGFEKFALKALEKNPSVSEAKKAVEEAEISYKIALADLQPEISASAGWQRVSSDDTYSAGLSGSLSLWNGLASVNKLKRLGLALERSRQSFRKTRLEVLYEVKIAWAQALKAEKEIALLEEILTRREENFNIVKLRYEAGREDAGVLSRTEANLFEVRWELEKARRDYSDSLLALAIACGEEESIGGIDGDFEVKSPVDADLSEFIKQNPDYIIAGILVDEARYGVKISRAGFSPKLSANAGLSYSAENFPPGGEPSFRSGISLSVPLFTGGRTRGEWSLAELGVEKARENLRRTYLSVLYQMQEAFNSLQNSADLVEVREKYLLAAALRAEIMREKYLNGLASYEDWDTVETDYTNARKNVLNARHQAFVSEASFWKLAGEEEK